MMLTRWLLVVVPSSLAFTAPRVAEACTLAPCSPASFTPGEGASAPANAPGLLWVPQIDHRGETAPDPTKVSLVRASDPTTKLPFTAMATTDRRAFLLVPDAPLTAGESYVVADAAACEGLYPHVTSRFVVGPAAPLPSTLGTLGTTEQVIESRLVDTYTGSCVSEVTAAQRTITLAMDPATQAWGDLLQIRTFVDDRVWATSAALVRSGVDNRPVGASVSVFRTCAAADLGADAGLSAGTHVIRMQATLAGTALPLASTTVTVTLDCGGVTNPPPVDPPVTPPVTPPVAPPGAGGGDGSDGGCNTSGSGSLAWLGLALGALLVRRRARR